MTIDRNKIIAAMQETVMFLEKKQEYLEGINGAMMVKVKITETCWEATELRYGNPFTAPQLHHGRKITNGSNCIGTAYTKAAYIQRTRQHSGSHFNDMKESESYWQGALISDDGNCICAFSGVDELDDVKIAQAGIACYNAMDN